MSGFIVTHNDLYAHDCTDVAAVKNGGSPEYMYHDRTAWLCAFFVGRKYGCSKGYPQRNAAHMGSISLWISFASIFFIHKKCKTPRYSIVVHVFRGAAIL
jgi:hypothetical protein